MRLIASLILSLASIASAQPSTLPSFDGLLETMRAVRTAERLAANDELQGVRGELEGEKAKVATLAAERDAYRAKWEAATRPTPPVVKLPEWTVLPAATGRIVHVSATGDDKSDGTEAKPLKTVNAALKLKPQRVLFKAGETFAVSDTVAGIAVIGSYGTGRATLTNPKGPALHLWFASDVLVVGLKLQGDVGARLWNCNNVRFEDCDLSGSRINAELTGTRRTNGVTFYGCIITDAFSTNAGRSQGVYAEQVDNLLIDYTLLDRNGWKPGQTMTTPPEGNHGLYAHETCGPVTVRRSVISRSCATGLLMRTGGVVEDCLFIDNPIHLSASGDGLKVTGSTFAGDQRLAGDATYNEGQYGTRRGWGIDLATATATVTGNLFAGVPTPIRENKPERTDKPLGVRVTTPNEINATVPAFDPKFLDGARRQSRTAWDVRYGAGAVK